MKRKWSVGSVRAACVGVWLAGDGWVTLLGGSSGNLELHTGQGCVQSPGKTILKEKIQTFKLEQ